MSLMHRIRETRVVPFAVAVGALLVLTACKREEPPGTFPATTRGGPATGSLPEGHPPIDGMTPASMAKGEVPATAAGGLGWTLPAGWVEETPKSAMRRAQFRVPRAAGDSEDGECVVFYFGPGQGGGIEDNAKRWVAQFAAADGSGPTPDSKIEKRMIGSHEATVVEARGTYAGGMPAAGGAAATKSAYALLGAIVTGPDAPWFFKLTGPAKTIEAARSAFESLIGSLK